MQKHEKFCYVVDIKEPDANIETTTGDIEKAPIQAERPGIYNKASFLRTQETNVEPPAEQFRQRLKRKVNQMSVKSAEEDSYLVTWKWIHPMIFQTGNFKFDILK